MPFVSGIILGLDTDTPETPERILEFIEKAHIPMLTINLLQALPRTALHARLSAEGRILEDETLESNVMFKQPYASVVSAWKEFIGQVYRPEALYARFAYNIERTYPNRIDRGAGGARASWSNVRRGLTLMRNLIVEVGIKADYRRSFWRMASPLLKQGMLEDVIHVGLVAHHLISYAREALSGWHNASYYSPRVAPIARHATPRTGS